MISVRLNNMAITIEKKGTGSFTKASFPIRYGTYSEIRTSDYEFQFNLKGQIKFIRGLGTDWPHPSEWLKRTDGNDWVYYSVGSVGEKIISCLGEYYLPCLPYPSNSIWELNPFTDPNIMKALGAWYQLYGTLYEMRDKSLNSHIRDFLTLITTNNDNTMFEESKQLQAITGGRLSVLPPDTRHVDYEVIPLIIADGCLYHCKFCAVKSRQRFQTRAWDDILDQIEKLKEFHGRNLSNYKSLFLGNHDALGAGDGLICRAAMEARGAFGFDDSKLGTPAMFLFGSVDSLLNAGNAMFEKLDGLPFHTYINVGFESIDPDTLASINKPLETSRIREAFEKMLQINQDHVNIEITGNFLLGEMLSTGHYESLADLLGTVPKSSSGKGTIYLSPMMQSKNRSDLLKSFHEIKALSRIPTFLYLIQRL